MTFTLQVKSGVVMSCMSRLGPMVLDYCEIAEAVQRIYELMRGQQFEIEFRNV